MKFFTNQCVVQKIVISIVIVILTTFCIPVSTVQADWGGKLASPIVTFVVAIFDGVQHLLERAMLGETSGFMKDIEPGNYKESATSSAEITTDEFIDATFFGLNAVNVPVITYTPEEIFSNKVPALDINFINPSVKTGDNETDQKMNIAIKLRPTIASWYLALRSIAVVGLLSVLIYLGIRMLLTSVAADRAKYKQMLMDWVIAMCLVFVLHYIMSFCLTMAETVTAMLASNTDGTFTVHATKIDGLGGSTYSISFAANLMSYVRFMVQAGDFNVKIAHCALYIMLVIFSIRFTWIYLKRVVNMAFLTLMAPMVALTYPIDKVSDGKAQAFNMWIKEYTYNAIIQPVDLLLYKVLLGTAIELAANNPLYGIVALGFIIAAEKLVKQMFGFNKASGGTVGSLAGAAGVTAIAGKMLNNAAQKAMPGGNGGKGKIRTKEAPERQGKDADSNKPFKAFEGKEAGGVIGAGADDEGTPSPNGGSETPQGGDPGVPPPDGGPETLPGGGPGVPPPDGGAETPQGGDLGVPPPDGGAETSQGGDLGVLPPGQEPNPFGPDVIPNEVETWRTMREKDRQAKLDRKAEQKQARLEKKQQHKRDKESGELSRKRAIKAYQTFRGIKAAAPAVAYKAARGTLRTASRVALAGTMGAAALAIGATTGDGEKAVSMAAAAAGVGFAAGDNLFEATVGKAARDKSIRDAYGSGKYGNATDAENARADKEYFKSEKFDRFYDKYYKDKYTKKQVREFVQDYRKAGITDQTKIRRAKKLEEKYMQRDKLSQKDARAQVQNIVQSYEDMDIDKKAYSDEKVRQKEVNRIAGMLGGDPKSANNQQMAKQIFRGFEDWRDSAV